MVSVSRSCRRWRLYSGHIVHTGMRRSSLVTTETLLRCVTESQQFYYATSCHCVQLDINQDHNSVRLAVRIGLEEVRKDRKVETVRAVTDTGGENWGNQLI